MACRAGLLACAMVSLPSASLCSHVELWAALCEPCRFQHGLCLNIFVHMLILRGAKHPELYLKPLSTMDMAHLGTQGPRKWMFTRGKPQPCPWAATVGEMAALTPCAWKSASSTWAQLVARGTQTMGIGVITNLLSITSCCSEQWLWITTSFQLSLRQ